MLLTNCVRNGQLLSNDASVSVRNYRPCSETNTSSGEPYASLRSVSSGQSNARAELVSAANLIQCQSNAVVSEVEGTERTQRELQNPRGGQ